MKPVILGTMQETFSKVVSHLRAQGEPAWGPIDDEGNRACFYRSDSGLKCAVGCLIPDDFYSPAIEGRTVDVLIKRGLIVFPVDSDVSGYTSMLDILQETHDRFSAECWEDKFEEIASRFDLVLDPPSQ